MDFEKKVPEWEAEGTEPPASLKSGGFEAGYKPPAAFFNWFWHGVSACLTEIRAKLSGHADSKDNPHGVTAAQVGLDKVNNTPDTEKNVAFASEAAAARKVNGSFILRFNGGKTENTDLFTYDGSVGKSANLTPDRLNAAEKDLGNVAEADFAEKAKSAGVGIPIAAATSADGIAYTATVDGVTELYNGLIITIVPSVNSASTAPTLNVNGLGNKMVRLPLSFNNAAMSAPKMDTYISKDRPLTLQYDAAYLNNDGIWKVFGKQKTSAQDLYGKVPVESGGVPEADETDDEGKYLTSVAGVPTWKHARASYVANLLHNSNLVNPINQRGATTYTGTGNYTVDRWYLTGSNSKATVRTTDVRVETTAGSSYASLGQRVANIKQYAGKTLTLAAKVYSNVVPRIYARNNVSGTYVTLGNVVSGKAATLATLVYSFTVPDDVQEGNLDVIIQSQSTAVGDYVSIYWAALYEGEFTAETLPPYQPKDYAAELLECQRYFLAVRASAGYPVGLGSVYSAGSGRILIPTPVQMRTNPTVSIEYDSTAGEHKLEAAGSQYSVTAFASPTARTNGVHVAATAGNAPAHQPCTLILSQAGKLCLSADL